VEDEKTTGTVALTHEVVVLVNFAEIELLKEEFPDARG
jgi:hypothetical protein